MLWYIAAIFCAFRYLLKVKIKELTKKAEKIAVISMVLLLWIPCVMGIVDTILCKGP